MILLQELAVSLEKVVALAMLVPPVKVALDQLVRAVRVVPAEWLIFVKALSVRTSISTAKAVSVSITLATECRPVRHAVRGRHGRFAFTA